MKPSRRKLPCIETKRKKSNRTRRRILLSTDHAVCSRIVLAFQPYEHQAQRHMWGRTEQTWSAFRPTLSSRVPAFLRQEFPAFPRRVRYQADLVVRGVA